MSNSVMLMVLRRMGFGGLTAHGFRSSFRGWAAEETSFPRELAEAALAHIIGTKTELAYQRGDLLAKRRRMMEAWADFCGGLGDRGMAVAPEAGGHRLSITHNRTRAAGRDCRKRLIPRSLP